MYFRGMGQVAKKNPKTMRHAVLSRRVPEVVGKRELDARVESRSVAELWYGNKSSERSGSSGSSPSERSSIVISL